MRLGLGNNLVNGGGPSNPDGLSLDLNFAADKTLTARKGPTPVFTRASGDTGGVTYFAPSDIIVSYSYLGNDYSIALNQDVATGVVNSRWQWTDSLFTIISYTGTAWALKQSGNLVATSAPTSQAWRPDLADWSGTGVVITNGTPYKLLRAATNEPRFDYDFSDLTSKGLLIEESRTNQTKYSYNNFTNGYWESTVSNVTAVDSVTTNPADSFIPTFSSLTEIIGASISRHIHETTGVFTPTANTSYTMSVWVKRPVSNQIRYVQLAFWIAGFGSTAYMNYDILLGQVKTGGAGITASSITAYPNGWYRITATATSLASPAASGFQLGFSTTSGAVRTEAYTVLSSPKSIYLWGAQVEQGAFATSYIPTTTTSLTRSADVCSITGVSTFYNATESTIFSEALVGSASNFNSVISFDNASASNQLALAAFPSPNTINAFVVSGGTTSASPTRPLTLGVFFKAASSNKLNAFQISMNGTKGTIDTSGAMPVGISTFNIGRAWNGATINGCLKSVKVYKKAMSDAKLQALTTP
jgi:hypothetical protein